MLKRTLLALVLYVLVSLGSPYIVYKHLPPSFDARHYLELVDRPWGEIDAPAPYRHRLLTPLAARSIWRLPYLATEIRATDELGSISQRAFFHLIVVNYTEALLASALCFYLAHAVFHFDAPLAFIGGLFFLVPYPSLASWLLTDVGAHVFIVLGLICYFRQWIWAFALVGIVGAMQKEFVVVVLGAFLFLEAYRRWLAIWPWCVALLPGVLAYLALALAWPARIHQLDRGTIGWPTLRSIGPMLNSEYLLTMTPFFACVAAHVYLRVRHREHLQFPLVWLWLVPILTAVSVLTTAVEDDWATSGRHSFACYGVIMLYQLEVLEHVAARCGWINNIRRRDASVWSPWTVRAPIGGGSS